MKDTSKAQWPDGMVYDGYGVVVKKKDDNGEEYEDVIVIWSDDLANHNSDVGDGICRHRFAQICALPEMVELILLLADRNLNIAEAEKRARQIRKQIGETE